MFDYVVTDVAPLLDKIMFPISIEMKNYIVYFVRCCYFITILYQHSAYTYYR